MNVDARLRRSMRSCSRIQTYVRRRFSREQSLCSIFTLFKSDDREALKHYLNEQGIETGLHYPIPLHLQEAYANLGYKKGDFPVSESLSEHILSLPMFPTITREQIEYVCSAVMEFAKCQTAKV